MELWFDFTYLIANNEYFRAGFVSGLVLVAIIWISWGLFYRLYAQWLKIRQFFEPIKKPGRVPTETGPSPASILLGCLWRIIFALLFIAILVVLWLWLAPGG
jgi:hypothetical protein